MPDPLPFQFAQKVNSVKDIELPRYVREMASIGPSMHWISSPSLRTCAGASLTIRSIRGIPITTTIRIYRGTPRSSVVGFRASSALRAPYAPVRPLMTQKRTLVRPHAFAPDGIGMVAVHW